MVDINMDSRKREEKLIRYLKKWCDNPNNDLRSTWVRELRKTNQKQSKESIIKGSLQLWFWANWNAQHGLLAILNGDSKGWEHIELSFRYRLLRMNIDASMTQVAEASLLFIHAISLNDREKSEWLAEYQSNSLINNLSNLWKFSRLGIFGLELWAKYNNSMTILDTLGKLPNAPDIGVYGDIFRYWKDDMQLANSIRYASDYHLEQALTQEGFPEFALSPYNLLPIEYIALRSVRDSLGMSTPLPEHPLLRYEFLYPSKTNNNLSEYMDPVVMKFIENATGGSVSNFLSKKIPNG